MNKIQPKEEKVKETKVEIVEGETAFPEKIKGITKDFEIFALNPTMAAEVAIKRAELLEKIRPHLIKATRPQDWTKHGDKFFYLSDAGCQRIKPILGLQILNIQGPIREDFPDGTYAYWYRADAFSSLLGVLIGGIEGGRSSKDPFFQNQEEPDPGDVRKAAFANLEGRIVRNLAGLHNLSEQDLIEAVGEDFVKRIQGISYKKKSESKQQKERKPERKGPEREKRNNKAKDEQINAIKRIAESKGIEMDVLLNELHHKFGIRTLAELTYEQAAQVIQELQGEQLFPEEG